MSTNAPRRQRCPIGEIACEVGQIDNPYLDAASNGLSYLIERMKGQRLAGHVTLSKTERSDLASLAAEIL